MKKFTLLFMLLFTVAIFAQKKEQIILDKPEIITYGNVSVKLERYYDQVLVSLNTVAKNSTVIYRGHVSSTKGITFFNSYFLGGEWTKIQGTDNSSGFLDYINKGIMEITLSDIKDTYTIYIFSSSIPNDDIAIFIQINKL